MDEEERAGGWVASEWENMVALRKTLAQTEVEVAGQRISVIISVITITMYT